MWPMKVGYEATLAQILTRGHGDGYNIKSGQGKPG